MKHHSNRHLLWVAGLLLCSLLLTSCESDEPPVDSTAPPVSDRLPTAETTAASVQNNTYNNNYYVSTGDPNQNGNNPSGNQTQSGTVNVGNTTAGNNESKGLAFTSNGNGTCTLTGIGTCSDACLVIPTQNSSGERVTAISEKAFYGNTSITAIFLPASVSSIGSMAFSAMPSLAYFSVDTTNPSYRSESGVLYTYDRATLLAYPAAKSAGIITLPSSIKAISDMAFYGCTGLTGIAYEGSISDWQKIAIGSGNNSLFGLGVQYNSTTGK